MKLAKQDLVAALRLRYDHYSADAIFTAAIERANLPDLQEYDANQVAAFRVALDKVGDRLANVHTRIDSLLSAPAVATPSPTVTARPEPKPEPKPEAKPDNVETTIALAGVDAREGEQVLICGGYAELGDWDPARARPMRKEGDRWLTTVRVPTGIDVPFKFLRRAPDGTVTWEVGDDRHLVAKPRVEATWRAA